MKLSAVLAVLFLLAGCASWYEQSADREVLPVVGRSNDMVNKDLAEKPVEGVMIPKPGPSIDMSGPSLESSAPSTDSSAPAVESSGAGVESTAAAVPQPPQVLTLKDSLAIAFSTSRDYQFAKESLYLSALAFTAARHQFDWIPSGVITSSVNGVGGPSGRNAVTDDANATLALSRRLLSGGVFSVSGQVDQVGVLSGPATAPNSSSLQTSFAQPLLAGTGAAAREPLVQATRQLLYDARNFELFREQLAIDIANKYYALLAQRKVIDTAIAHAQSSDFLNERSKALFEKGKATLVDVFRAEQDSLQAQNDVENQRSTYSLMLDQFKITLNMPTDKPVEIADEKIEPTIVEVSVEAAVKTALSNRLDLLTAKEQLVDFERQTDIARNALLPELDFFAKANSAGVPGRLQDFDRDSSTASTGVTFIIPLDKTAQRNAYRTSLISLARARRTFQLAQDNAILDVRESVRNLRQTEVTLVIQKKTLQVSADQLEAARLYFDKGTGSNRDIVDAQTNLQNAENAYTQAQVTYFIGYLQLKKNLGTLRIDEKGQWY
jgi:outer membrane protein TolC